MLTPQEKLKIIREGAINPGLAILSCFQLMSDEIMALLSQNMTNIQEAQGKKHDEILLKIEAISSAVEEMKSAIAVIDVREIDEDRIIKEISSSIQIPTARDGHTPTQEELLALIKSVLPKKEEVSVLKIQQMIQAAMPKKSEPAKPLSEDELTALVEPIVKKIQDENDKQDSDLVDKIKNIEAQIKTIINLPRTAKNKKGGKYLHGAGQFMGSQEKSSTIPNGVLQTFSFSHTPALIYWNGQFQFLGEDYSVSGSSITFTGSLIPVIGDKIINVYA